MQPQRNRSRHTLLAGATSTQCPTSPRSAYPAPCIPHNNSITSSRKKNTTPYVSHPVNAGNIGSTRHAHVSADCSTVMGSFVQTRTQPTQQQCCPLCGWKLNYTYCLYQLRRPSSHCLPHRVNKELVLPCLSVAEKVHPLSRVQMSCLPVGIMAICFSAQKCEQLCLVLVDSAKFSPFLGTVHYWSWLGDAFIYHLESCACSFKESGT